VQDIEERAGGAANVAVNLAALGSSVHLFGVTGDDDHRRMLCALLDDAGVTYDLLTDKNVSTISKLRLLGKNQQLMRLDFEKTLHMVKHDDLLSRFTKELNGAQVVILSDYAKGTLAHAQKLISLAKEAGVPCFVDPKGSDFSRYQGAFLLTPNMKEFTQVMGPCQSDEHLVEKAMMMIEQLDLQALLVTRSEKGISLIQKNPLPGQAQVAHIPTRAREVFDVTGAGDTVVSVLAAAYASIPEDLISCARLANIAASVVVSRSGTSAVSEMELRRAVAKVVMPDQAIMGVDELMRAVAEAKSLGEKVVMTNGCFDLLHAGHVHYLQQARALGNRLIVAVNSDASVAKLKGETRPINKLQHRMEVLAGLSAVDYVVAFDDDTPQQLIEQVVPDVLVKGGDYQVEEIAGHKKVLSSGGRVEILDFIPGCSTTEMIKRISTDLDSKTDKL
jgi:D-beta-D-heptose 7-phosphate kinase / D-beta-D-heptose 1-phosphate adenosyltransferase